MPIDLDRAGIFAEFAILLDRKDSYIGISDRRTVSEKRGRREGNRIDDRPDPRFHRIAKCLSRRQCGEKLPAGLANAFVVGEEKQFVLCYRTADVSAKLVKTEMGPRKAKFIIKEIIGVEML